MSEELTEQEFDSLLRRSAPLLSPTAVAKRIEGSRRRYPVELLVFQNLPADSEFTAEEWADWSRVILHALSCLDETASQICGDIIASHNEKAGDQNHPMDRMVGQLEEAGYVEICKLRCRISVTAQGNEFLQRTARGPE